MKTSLFILLVAILTILLSCKETKEDKKQTEIIDTSLLNAYFSNEMPSNEPGGAILIMKADSVIFSKGYGMADQKQLVAKT